MVAMPPNVSNEVIMEALRIKSDVVIADTSLVSVADIARLLPLVDGGIDNEVVRRQVVLIAIAFMYPDAKQPDV